MTDAQKKQKSDNGKSRREWYRSHGICNRCGQMWADAGYRTCKACRRKNKRSRDKNDPGRERWKEARRKLRAERIAQGLCTQCGAPAVEGLKYCQRCLEARRDSSRKYRILRRIEKQAREARARR